MSDSATTRPMRADARRNHGRLLDAARTAFTEHGTEASLEDIARRSGVGIGTLYRHFPTRDALLEALLRERFDELTAHARQLLDAPSPRRALAEWMRMFVVGVNTYRGLIAALLTTLRDETSDLSAACQTMRATGAALLARTQAAGEARPDIHALELFTLVSGVAWANEQASAADPTRVRRLVELVLDGIGPVNSAKSPLAQPTTIE
jgi:AcrR family transcriptional regulator